MFYFLVLFRVRSTESSYSLPYPKPITTNSKPKSFPGYPREVSSSPTGVDQNFVFPDHLDERKTTNDRNLLLVIRPGIRPSNRFTS